jgi:hypothetical protein
MKAIVSFFLYWAMLIAPAEAFTILFRAANGGHHTLFSVLVAVALLSLTSIAFSRLNITTRNVLSGVEK